LILFHSVSLLRLRIIPLTLSPPLSPTADANVFTWDEVKKHSSAEDAWVVYQNKVYDVSDWYEHPGGAVIFTHAGDDMTDIFAAFHAAGSHAAMRRFYIGELDTKSMTHKDQGQVDFEAGYRVLRSKLIQMGMFKSSKVRGGEDRRTEGAAGGKRQQHTAHHYIYIYYAAVVA